MWKDAEQSAADFLTACGLTNVRLTACPADGGIDIIADGLIAQVKSGRHAVGRPRVQQLVGARRTDQTVWLAFFSRSGFTRDAVLYGLDLGIALFVGQDPITPLATRIAAGLALPIEPSLGQIQQVDRDQLIAAHVQAELDRRAVKRAEYVSRQAAASALWSHVERIETASRRHAKRYGHVRAARLRTRLFDLAEADYPGPLPGWWLELRRADC